MPNYNNSKIYKIVNEELKGLVYYGSTTTTLKRRFKGHKDDCKRDRGCSSKIMFSVGTPEIILLEDYPCETKEELLKRERVWIEGNECVNCQIPGRTDAEYYQDVKETYLPKCKIYRDNNKEKVKKCLHNWWEKNKDSILIKQHCECGGKYTHQNKTNHFNTKKHIKFIENKNIV